MCVCVCVCVYSFPSSSPPIPPFAKIPIEDIIAKLTFKLGDVTKIKQFMKYFLNGFTQI